jgi:hypothetical protein
LALDDLAGGIICSVECTQVPSVRRTAAEAHRRSPLMVVFTNAPPHKTVCGNTSLVLNGCCVDVVYSIAFAINSAQRVVAYALTQLPHPSLPPGGRLASRLAVSHLENLRLSLSHQMSGRTPFPCACREPRCRYSASSARCRTHCRDPGHNSQDSGTNTPVSSPEHLVWCS